MLRYRLLWEPRLRQDVHLQRCSGGVRATVLKSPWTLNDSVRQLTRAGVLQRTRVLYDMRARGGGERPNAFFLAGKGESPRPDGTKIPDETGRVRKLTGYVNATVRLTLPGNLTVDDIDWFAVYCITYSETFIQAKIPKGLNVPPNIKLLLSECSSSGGVCPDTRVGGSEDLQLVSARYENGVVDVVYSRKLATVTMTRAKASSLCRDEILAEVRQRPALYEQRLKSYRDKQLQNDA
ncbi:hypothetical protein HPB52_001814 [Rhipicephalus sanguineus]|uniref:DM13 domain-containing protein n=1 Tax=Rhipicephalus sanguineus TaxID=34632 RepID=A0A9D4T762_RHISA|nr:hypothetical protein HPB52_001814 [Rhipicephalus sanguineus]